MVFNLAVCECNAIDTKLDRSLRSNKDGATINQGVWGNVWFWEGNWMPYSGQIAEPRGNKITPVIREIFFYKATTIQQLIPYHLKDGPFYSFIPTELVAKTSSNVTGFYQVELRPGLYSVFIKEGTVYFANKGDGVGRLNTVEVQPGKVIKLQLDITYKAGY